MAKHRLTVVQRDYLEQAASTIIPMLTCSDTSLNVAWLAEHFTEKNQSNIDCLLAASSLFTKAGTPSQSPAATPELQQLAAKVGQLTRALQLSLTEVI